MREVAAVFVVASSALLACGGGAPDEDAPAPDYEALFADAESLYFSGDLDSARVVLEQLQASAAQDGTSAAAARALTWIGLVSYRTGDYDAATTIGRNALELKLANGLDDQLARSYNALGLAAYMQDHLTESLAWYARADSIATVYGDDRMRFAVAANAAISMIEQGRFTEARERLFAARDFMAEAEDARLEGNALVNLGMLDIRLGDPSAGLSALREALELYRSIDYPTGETNALGHVGTAYTALGQPRAALAALDSALALAQEQGMRGEEASAYELMAEVYRGAGDFPRALDLYGRAIAINAETGADWERGIDLRGEADIHVRLGDFGRARSKAIEALDLHRGMGAPLEEMRDLLMLAEVADRLEETAQTELRLEESRNLADRLDAPIARVEAALAAARIHDRHRRSRIVVASLDRVTEDLGRGGYAAEWEAAWLRSRALQRLGDLPGATIAGRRAVEAVERVRGNFASGALRTSFASDKRDVYAQLVSVLLRGGEVEEAFSVADGARGRALLEQTRISGRERSAGSSLDEGEELLREIAAVEERIAYFEDYLPEDRSPGARAELVSLYERLPRLRSRYELLLVQVSEVDAGAATILGGRRTDAGEVRRALGPRQLLVDYFVPTEGAVILFVARPDGLHVLEAPVEAADLTSRVRLARDLITRRDTSGRLSGVLEGLHEALVRPVIAAGLGAEADELIIVPHDVLTYLPFAALLDETTGRYVAEDYALRFLPSAAALPVLRDRVGGGTAPGAPQAFAPFPDELPASRDEVRSVAQRLRGDRHEGRRATESALRSALESSRIVHVATHAELNRLNPVFSRLTLAPGRAGSDDDGQLEVHELAGLRVAAELVFLSGCETGLGIAGSSTFAPGDDFSTLSQSVLFAGADHVVATLWSVHDQAASELAARFYEELDAIDAAGALARAQRALLSSEEYRDPYYWAAYQISGVSGPTP